MSRLTFGRLTLVLAGVLALAAATLFAEVAQTWRVLESPILRYQGGRLVECLVHVQAPPDFAAYWYFGPSVPAVAFCSQLQAGDCATVHGEKLIPVSYGTKLVTALRVKEWVPEPVDACQP